MRTPTKTARQRPPGMLSVTLTTLLAGLLVVTWLSLAGCGSRGSPTPTPTKTPTQIPSATPQVTLTLPADTRATTVAAAPAHTPTKAPTATPTLRPTPTPQPTPAMSGEEPALPASEPGAEQPECPDMLEPSDAYTIQQIMGAALTRAANRPPTTQPPEAAAQSPSTPRPAAPAHTPTPAAPAAVAPVTSGGDINPLTGLPVPSGNLNRRPLAVKVPNFPFSARPQSGLSRADVVIEHEAEAYLTRFTAIFYGNDAPVLGPIRSLRLPDAELVPIFRAVLVASGGHPAVKIRITEGKPWADGYLRVICPEEPFLGDGGAMRRIDAPGRRYELTLYSDTASLWNVVGQRGVNQRPDFGGMWTFDPNPPAGGTPATHLRIVYKPTWSESEYHYDPGVNAYRRYDVGQPLIDALTGQQIAPTNVLLLYAPHANSDILADAHDPDHPWYAVLVQLWGQGSGKLFRDGQVYDIQWVRQDAQGPNDRLLILDGQGRQVPLHPGTTWIQLTRPGAPVQID